MCVNCFRLIVGVALVVLLLFAAYPKTVSADVLGTVWYEQEVAGWKGVWTRRGSSNEFDARFTNPSGQVIGGRLRISVNGRNVSIYRWNPGTWGQCNYQGKFSSDFSTASGTYACTRQDGSWLPTYRWQASIVGGSGGNVGAVAPSHIDPTGVWRHGSRETWTITRAANGRYYAREKGSGNASGPAYFKPNGVFRIDYTTRDGKIKGYYEVRFAADNKTAAGNWRELTGARRSGSTRWTRVGSASSGGSSAQSASSGLGRVWRENVGGWRGVWTRRGNSNTFDAVWTKGRHRVTGVLNITRQGNQVSAKRTQSSDGNLCYYSGTVGSNGRSITGTSQCDFYPGHKFNWAATISY